MKANKLLIVIIAVLVVMGSLPADASARVDPWPSCGEKVVSWGGGDYFHENFKFTTVDEKVDYHFYFNSYNGWKIYEIYMEFNPGSPVQQGSFPEGRTSYDTYSTEQASYVKVTLRKDCDYTPKCKTTDVHVYTLLGNYPCNLIAGDSSIPERFLNPNYVSYLCDLPEKSFDWNGKWVNNSLKTCDGYEYAGRYYYNDFGPQ